MKVLVIPEDFRKDQYILKPIITAIVKAAGVVSPRVAVCQNPRLRGVSQALRWDRVKQILEMYPMVDLFVLCVDRDGEAGRREIIDKIEVKATQIDPPRILVGENAWQELEVWALAGATDLPAEWKWADVQADLNPKENYYLHYVRMKKLDKTPDQGRELLAKQSAQRYTRLKQFCNVDVGSLENKIKTFING